MARTMRKRVIRGRPGPLQPRDVRRQWPSKPGEVAFESEFSERYIDVSAPGSIPPPRRGGLPTPQQPIPLPGVPRPTTTPIDVAEGGEGITEPGGIVENVPVGIAPARPTVRQTRAVNLAVTVGLAAIQILASNQKRSYLIIQNTSTSTIFVTFDRPSSFATGIQILPGGNYEPFVVPVNSVWAIANSANLPVVVIEGTTT